MQQVNEAIFIPQQNFRLLQRTMPYLEGSASDPQASEQLEKIVEELARWQLSSIEMVESAGG